MNRLNTLVILWSLTGIGCGTQVGNGLWEDGKSKSPSLPTDEAERAFQAGSPTDISILADGLKLFGATPDARAQEHIFLKDASPALEMGQGTFREVGSFKPSFKVGPRSSKGEVVISLSGTTTTLLLKADPTYGAYSINIDLKPAETITAGPVQSVVQGDTTTRSVTFSDGYQTLWDLDSNKKVQTVRVKNAVGIQVLNLSYIAVSSPVTEPSVAGQVDPILSTTIDWREVSGSNPKTFVDGMTGLRWSADDRQSYTTVEAAKSRCEVLAAIGGVRWRLPTFTELNTAYDHEIGGRLANAQALDINASLGGYWTSTAADATNYWTINLVEPERSIAIVKKAEPTPLSTLCVH